MSVSVSPLWGQPSPPGSINRQSAASREAGARPNTVQEFSSGQQLLAQGINILPSLANSFLNFKAQQATIEAQQERFRRDAQSDLITARLINSGGLSGTASTSSMLLIGGVILGGLVLLKVIK